MMLSKIKNNKKLSKVKYIKRLGVLLAATISLNLCGCGKNTKEYSETRFLMDTVCTVKVCADDNNAAKAAGDEVFLKAEDIADKADYFSEDSEVAKINNAKANEKVEISNDTFKIISKALEVYYASDGAFDITVAPVKDLWGFSDGDHMPPDDEEIKIALQNVGADNLILSESHNDNNNDNENINESENNIRYFIEKKVDNIKIDLGAAAKGYALDCAKEVIKKYDISYAVIDLGGSIMCIGDNPKRDDKKWVIGLQKPFGDTGEYSKTVEVKDEAVVTSGVYQRFFKWDGVAYHHILDPKTGYPCNTDIDGVSIVADCGLTADCLSTAYMVLGEEAGNNLIKKYGARAVIQNKSPR